MPIGLQGNCRIFDEKSLSADVARTIAVLAAGQKFSLCGTLSLPPAAGNPDAAADSVTDISFYTRHIVTANSQPGGAGRPKSSKNLYFT